MRNDRFLSRTFILIIAAVLLAGCASSPQARFYTLTPLVSSEAKQPAGEAARHVAVNVAPVEIPDYLDRPQIVTREGRNGVKLAEYDRWAGSLAENITAVLAEDLALLLGTDNVFVNAEKTDHSVAVRVLRLDTLPGDQVLLKTQWTVSPGPDGKNPATHVSNITEKLNDTRYDTMVAAVNRAVEQMSREIAGQIQIR